MVKKLAVFNLFSVLLSIAVSILAQLKLLSNHTIGEISDKYPTLFTPADYAFSIWSVIYLALLASALFMVYQAFSKGPYTDFITNSSGWFIVANLGTVLWTFAWVNDYVAAGAVLIFLILAKLCKIIINNDMELTNAPFKVIAFYWWPICIFSGWVSVAAVANLAVFFKDLEWDAILFSEIQWTILVIILTAIINIIMIYTRNMREFAAIGVWGLMAIYVRHIDEIELIAYVALGASVLIFANISYHGYKNRKTNPVYKLIHGEKL